MDITNILSSFQLVGASIKQLNISNNFVFLNSLDSSLQKNIDVSYDIIHIEHIEDKNVMLGTIQLHINITIKDKNNDGVYTLSLVNEGCFESLIANPEINMSELQNKFEKSLALNGCTALYSISRASIVGISSLTCSGTPITLPMINVFKLVKHSSSDKE